VPTGGPSRAVSPRLLRTGSLRTVSLRLGPRLSVCRDLRNSPVACRWARVVSISLLLGNKPSRHCRSPGKLARMAHSLHHSRRACVASLALFHVDPLCRGSPSRSPHRPEFNEFLACRRRISGAVDLNPPLLLNRSIKAPVAPYPYCADPRTIKHWS
jgi:hypothetical protein